MNVRLQPQPLEVPVDNLFEKLGAFYLGKRFDPSTQSVTDDLILYDAKDLTTHAVCVGMTGSGKTGLCLSLLEEAAIDGVPTLAIDPKGDLGNLLLTFPELRPQDFEPWVDPAEAARKNMTPQEFAADRAALWTKGLAQWGQEPARIARFRDAVDLAIYTPGSTAGLPLSVIKSFAAPPEAIRNDADMLRERITAAVSGLLALLGIDADPLQSREHVLLSNILQHAWSEGRNLDLAGLIQAIQSPPVTRIGVLELDAFYPPKDRFALAMQLNNLLASPGFAAWMQGEPLEVQRLLWTPEGKPRIAIISIAHLPDSERMFIVTQIMNEVLAWARSQAGTSSLRAILYMDEVFGYLPPTANPPSKMPLLTLLKQARAFGLGVVLATQNPVDLDYKGLSNTGTWFLGRLQTARDKDRVLDGLEGASAATGSTFNRAALDTMLAGLGSRVFLLHNVHEDGPVLFQTRWALSYLRGPLTRTQIQLLMQDKAAQVPGPIAPAGAAKAAKAAPAPEAARPVLPPDVPEAFWPSRVQLGDGETLVYRPALLGETKLHFANARAKVDLWRDSAWMVALDDDAYPDPWEDAEPVEQVEVEPEPEAMAAFDALPKEASDPKSYARWQKTLVTHLYRTQTVSVLACKELKETSEPGESEGDFRARLGHAVREQRDEAKAKLEKKYAPKMARLQERIRKAEARVEVQKDQYDQQKLQTAASIGATVLGALFGRKTLSVGNARRASSTIGRASRTAKEKGDITRAQADVEAAVQALQDLEAEFQEALEAAADNADTSLLEFTETVIKPRKADILVDRLALVWLPWVRRKDGAVEPAYSS